MTFSLDDLAGPGPLPDQDARTRVLETAYRLFYRYGLRATGIDRIIAESGVAKMSFYRHFPSKQALIDAYLDLRHVRWMAWLEGRLAGLTSRDWLAALPDALDDWFGAPGFRGCAFINGHAEAGPDAPAMTVTHKRELAARIEQQCADAGLARPAEVAADLLLALEGAIVRAQMDGADVARGALHRLFARTLSAAGGERAWRSPER
ncbi:TetR/AcrR family transcriptional regulator [Methyloversatilis sp.]|uniref:TetR/AcrR family transcriptional regulator n=1 Tax=Methyloversatilis sp. TaxID=2569862 RepID=UPI002733D5C3|nr:TetR/AcrR family transcriptional regulator [Methyloversatilis sp.]MDP3455921.1 TetR/AcrR family transcriptional regulator [Methyloversatilis sp.]MDP3576929.1 TetR/AcrR family transcriptional regulator [Methyloversatilis sp.]